MVNKAWIRNTSKQNVTRPPLPHLLTFCLSFPLAFCSALSSPVDIQRIVVPFFQFAVQVTLLHNGAVLGGWWVGRSSSPGQVRRGLITFQCCFSTLCKEQSVLISIDYRRMLIQCHTDGLQRQNESVASLRYWQHHVSIRQITLRRLLDFYCLPNLKSSLSNLWKETFQQTDFAFIICAHELSEHKMNQYWQHLELICWYIIVFLSSFLLLCFLQLIISTLSLLFPSKAKKQNEFL